MTDEKLKELLRRLTAEGYETELDERGAGTVRDGEQSVAVMENGEVRYKRENRELAFRIRAIYDEVNEYMTAFERAAPVVERFPGDGAEYTRTLLMYANHELAGRSRADGSVDFVTWRLDRDGERETGHYFDDYADAKEDFALRAGLIDRDKLFDEKELTVIRSHLSDYLDIAAGDRISYSQEQAIQNVIGKIDDVIAPAIEDEAEVAAEQGFEPEMEL
jgi:hypothetical protein